MSDPMLVFVLILLGLTLLSIEIFVIPGFGFAGILGFLCLVLGSVFAFYRLNPAVGIAVSVATVAVLIFMLKVFPKTIFWKWTMLDKTTSKADGYSATEDFTRLIGKKGVTITTLRPVGTVLVDGTRIDAVSEMGMIGKGEEVTVVKVEGNRIVVEET